MNSIPLAIAVGAVLGALSRYYITLFWIEKRGEAFPYGTLFVNLTGAFLIGLVSTVSLQLSFPIALQKTLLVGFLGAYTTFSSYILDSAKLLRSDRILTGLGYRLASPVLGFFCVELGIWVAQKLG
ncbi:fluoride efflux transporter CrcB [Myxosarcina sp. GI1(2024)]